jgi:hypothetical protein
MPVRNTREIVEVATQAPPAVRMTRIVVEVARKDLENLQGKSRRISGSLNRGKGG